MIPPYFDCPNVHGKFLRNRQTDNVGFIFSAALDELYDREPAECFAGTVQTAGKLSFFRKRQKFKRKLYEGFGRAVCFINDENGKTRALQHTGTAAIAHIKINFGCLVDIRLDVDCFFYTGLCTGIAGDFLKTLCDGNGAL